MTTADGPVGGVPRCATLTVRIRCEGLAASGAPAVFDAAMQDAVRRFQRDAGLAADGVVGPATLMALAAHEAPARTAALESDTGAQ